LVREATREEKQLDFGFLLKNLRLEKVPKTCPKIDGGGSRQFSKNQS
jgi:hypothetical protein